MVDRSEVSRALAKAIAYKNCGKDADANAWAIHLVKLLECGDIIDVAQAITHEQFEKVGHFA